MLQLMAHQAAALDQTAGVNRVAYYLDMGLGKTFVGSEKMAQLNTTANLIICQKSKINDWLEHFREYYSYTPEFTYDLTNKKQLTAFLEHVDHNEPGTESCYGIINYDLCWRRKELLQLHDFTLMLDESSLIQNAAAKRSKFILTLNPANVILLSGTPTGGKYENLWSQCHLLGWKISPDLYFSKYVDTVWVEDDGFWRQQIIGYKNVDRLKRKLREHGAVFMTTDEAGISLPKKTWITVKSPAPKEYAKFKKDKLVTIEEHELIGSTTLTEMLYLRQLCGLYNKNRYDAFADLVASTNDRLIVFYNFTAEMERMKEIVTEIGRPVSVLNGMTKDMTAYQEQEDSVSFIQYQAGAMGGNFQLSNKIIYFSMPLGSELWEQSQKRIHRIGQQRPCFYYLMMSPGTIEDKILNALRERRDYTEELFRNDKD